MKLNCVVIDDEFLARQYLVAYIEKLPFLNLLGDYSSPLAILEDIKEGNIDLLFLDIQMPDITGLEFLKTMDKQPYVIFTTAFKEYALEAYEHNVVDYLLKPFSFDRFLKAVNKVVDKIKMEKEGFSGKETDKSEKPQIEKNYMIVRADRKLYKINFDDLIFIEGQKAYVTFHTRLKKITALITLRELEDALPRETKIKAITHVTREAFVGS